KNRSALYKLQNCGVPKPLWGGYVYRTPPQTRTKPAIVLEKLPHENSRNPVRGGYVYRTERPETNTAQFPAQFPAGKLGRELGQNIGPPPSIDIPTPNGVLDLVA